ncbi:P-loop containing nucleoside triphosphate hydrolase protein [Sistotremastrum suecicum HHB10207 ss-3]|uniref:p-loop containing nucleoside triphosphate hydrolase protein n=1 Tax=Sistotremastrum suecicum HHB10207 ss-3 TaxID=1314776 RepID=A0A166E4H9_9AGAM|nr:P-loop containing nucleoside triphosphate hydrolase protein [Sistotremastrum suecicum HHB10207 ss-3]
MAHLFSWPQTVGSERIWAQGSIATSYAFGVLNWRAWNFIIEFGRKMIEWLWQRIKVLFVITARFQKGDQTYDWLMLLLAEERVWASSCDFKVVTRSSRRRWGIKQSPHALYGSPTASSLKAGNHGSTPSRTEYVPQYRAPHLFRYKGHWIEIDCTSKREGGHPRGFRGRGGHRGSHRRSSGNELILTVYSFRMSTLSDLVDSARKLYIEFSKPHVTIHQPIQPYQEGNWSHVVTKYRRPLDSLIIEESTKTTLLDDVKEFLGSESWYIDRGIPYRRGYLLHGPPGTGKTATIYTLAGELGLEIYVLTMSEGLINDAGLKALIRAVPSHAILLLEDIDCVSHSLRIEQDEAMNDPQSRPVSKSAVTLSGLLNAIDGVGTDRGRLIFCTTNHLNHLEPALLRPGRIDVKVEYKAASQAQARTLFIAFFTDRTPSSSSSHDNTTGASSESAAVTSSVVSELAHRFSKLIPPHEFIIPDLQGYLLLHRKDPQSAVNGTQEWVDAQMKERSDRKQRLIAKREKRVGGMSEAMKMRK